MSQRGCTEQAEPATLEMLREAAKAPYEVAHVGRLQRKAKPKAGGLRPSSQLFVNPAAVLGLD
jgi:hypothetical protein